MGKFFRRLPAVVSVLSLLSVPLLSTVSASALPTFTDYSLPTQHNSPTSGITAGPDGALWFVEYSNDKIGRTTTGGDVTEYKIPSSSLPGNTSMFDGPGYIAVGSDNALWFTEQNVGTIGRITTTGVFSEYTLPSNSSPSNPTQPGGIAAGTDGALWFTEYSNDKIGRITTSGNITEFSLDGSHTWPMYITAGPDGALWFSNLENTPYVGRITTSGTISYYSLPGGNASDITAGSDGALWLVQPTDNAISRVAVDGTVSKFAVPTSNGYPFGITSGPDGTLWFTELLAHKLGSITTAGSISEYALPSLNGNDVLPVGITIGPDGALWVTNGSGGNNYTEYVGKFNLTSVPAAPANLTIPSPAKNPSLKWDDVSGASSYNIYRNNSFIGSTANTSYIDNMAPEGTDTYTVTAVNDSGESGKSNTASVFVDRTPPTITYTISQSPNSAGWNNSPATVSFTCVDNAGGSGIASCPLPQTESADGSYTLSGTAADNAGNSSIVDVMVNVDQTYPKVTSVALATDPISVNKSTTLSANISDNLSGVSSAEYYEGTDPGQGKGTAMTITNDTATAVVGLYASAGMHTYYVRAEDYAGNWSTPMAATLDVFNPAGGYTAGHGSVVPNGSTSNTNPSDILPSETGNNIKAVFDFTLKYASSTSNVPTGSSTFTWGSTCNNPHANCFVVATDTALTPSIGSLSWLIMPGDNTATFQGIASLSQGTYSLGNNFPIRITTIGTTTTTPGHYMIQIYAIGANSDTATPLYQASGDLNGGSVVLHS